MKGVIKKRRPGYKMNAYPRSVKFIGLDHRGHAQFRCEETGLIYFQNDFAKLSFENSDVVPKPHTFTIDELCDMIADMVLAQRKMEKPKLTVAK